VDLAKPNYQGWRSGITVHGCHFQFYAAQQSVSHEHRDDMHPTPGRAPGLSWWDASQCTHALRAVKHFAWLKVGSVKMALPHPVKPLMLSVGQIEYICVVFRPNLEENMTSSGKSKKKDQDINIGKKYSMGSKVLKEERPYWVYLPNSYNEASKQRYPVLYLLDGDAHFQSTSGVVQFMSSGINGNCQTPEMIVVAIPNTNRTRDLTPTHSKIGISGNEEAFLESSGGGDAFLKFIRDELIPLIDSTFHTLPARVLVGHSLGGLLVIHALLEESDMFHGYIAIDPSLWWNNQLLAHSAEKKIGTIRKLRKSLYISSANSPKILSNNPMKMRKAIRKFVKTLDAARTKDFRLGFQYFDSEDHGSVPLLSLYHGLLFVFEGFKHVGVESLPAMKTRLHRLSKRWGGSILPSEGHVNNMGYMMLYMVKDVKKAFEFFEYNISNFPKSANVYDSLAEAYMVKGDKAQAIKNYKKSLKLDPNNQNAARMIRALKEKKETPDP
jgi:predicted alpha/beta superfamily hydrolase